MPDALETPALIDAVLTRLADAYVFPDRAAEAADKLRANLEAGEYGSPVDEGVCLRVNEDLLEASGDKHLRLIWHESADGEGSAPDDEDLAAELREQFRRANQGIRRVQRLPGNVGVIEVTIIPEAATAGAAIAAAMELVRHTDALILDLREARGGAPDGVAFFCSFLFPDGEVQLSDIVVGPDGPTRQYWTSGYVPGPRYADRPLYVLVSADTFSGGEQLAYDLKALDLVTIVGEVTRGGAHPSAVLSLGPHVELRLPVARSVSPVTGGNWEAVGVEPHIQVPSAEALDIAYRTILETLEADVRAPTAAQAEARAALEELAAR